MSTNDGGQAYPCAGLAGLPNDYFINPTEGMSLRDHFAGLAMQAFAFNPNGTMEDDVRAAWRYADAMLAAREQRT